MKINVSKFISDIIESAAEADDEKEDQVVDTTIGSRDKKEKSDKEDDKETEEWKIPAHMELSEDKIIDAPPAAVKAANAWYKKKLGGLFRISGKLASQSINLHPDGMHGNLCKSYKLEIEVSTGTDKVLGKWYAFRGNLYFEYKSGGSNGTSVGTVFVSPDGKVIQEY